MDTSKESVPSPNATSTPYPSSRKNLFSEKTPQNSSQVTRSPIGHQPFGYPRSSTPPTVPPRSPIYPMEIANPSRKPYPANYITEEQWFRGLELHAQRAAQREAEARLQENTPSRSTPGTSRDTRLRKNPKKTSFFNPNRWK